MKSLTLGRKCKIAHEISQKQKSINVDTISNYQILLKNISHAKNTFTSLRYNDKSVDINLKDVSQRVVIMMLESTVKDLNSPIANPMSLETMIDKWQKEERITLISAIINREIDQICIREHQHLTSENRKEIFAKLSKEYNIEINSKCAQSSIIQSLLRDSDVIKKISLLKIDNDLKNVFSANCLKETLLKIKNSPQESNDNIIFLSNKFNEDYHSNNAIINIENAKIRGSLYNDLAKHVYNTLFYSDNNQSVPFEEIIQKVNDLMLGIIKNQ